MTARDIEVFVRAIRKRQDVASVLMLENGSVPIDSMFMTSTGELWNMINLAIFGTREAVVRALVRLGVAINEFNICERMDSTPAGFAILNGKVSMLAVCHSLGSTFSNVHQSPFGPCSAIELAIEKNAPNCLEYLLDKVQATRPINLSAKAKFDLVTLVCENTSFESISMEIFEVLQKRKYDYEQLSVVIPGDFFPLVEKKSFCGLAVRTEKTTLPTYADLLLLNAHNSGDDFLLSYFVKDLGIKSKPCGIEAAATYKFNNALRNRQTNAAICNFLPQTGSILKDFTCGVCGAIATAKGCQYCFLLYCSPKCLGKHSRSAACKKLQAAHYLGNLWG